MTDEQLREIEEELLTNLRGRYGEGYQRSFVASALRQVRDQVTAEQQRWRDLVRFCRHELHEEGLITDEEYAAIMQDHPAVERLESYDLLRKNMKETEQRVRRETLKKAAEQAKWHRDHVRVGTVDGRVMADRICADLRRAAEEPQPKPASSIL